MAVSGRIHPDVRGRAYIEETLTMDIGQVRTDQWTGEVLVS